MTTRPLDANTADHAIDDAALDALLCAEGHVKTNFLCNLGYGDPSKLHPRLPRLPFAEACSLL